jgi:hypothetical protein
MSRFSFARAQPLHIGLDTKPWRNATPGGFARAHAVSTPRGLSGMKFSKIKFSSLALGVNPRRQGPRSRMPWEHWNELNLAP